MDDEWKGIIAQVVYGGFTLFAIIGAFLTQNLMITGTMAFILIIITIYVDNILRKILKKATGVTDEQLDEIKDDITPLTDDQPDIGTTPPG